MNKPTVLLLFALLTISTTGFSNPLTSFVGKVASKVLVKEETKQISKQVARKGLQAAAKATAKESIKIAAREAAKKGTGEIFVENLPKIIISTGVGVGAYEVAHNTTKPFVEIGKQIENGNLDGEAISSQFLDKTSNIIIQTLQQPLLALTLIVGLILFIRLVNIKQLADSIKSIGSQNKSNNTPDNTIFDKDNDAIEAVVISKK